MINVNFFIGKPLKFKRGIEIYPPTINDVITNERYGQYYQILTFTQEDISDELSKDKSKKHETIPTPFEFLLINSFYYKDYEKIAKEAFEFFLRKKVIFLYE